MASPVVPVRRISHTSVHGVANDGATAEVRGVYPHCLVQVPVAEGLVQRVEGHARLDETGVVVGVDVEDGAHATA